jgi:Zn-dependent protease with chaperone function
MTFFDNQLRAKRNSTKLVFLFGTAIISIIVSVYLVIVLLLRSQAGEASSHTAQSFPLWQPELFGLVAILLLLTICLGTFTKVTQLARGGGAAVAKLVGGIRIPYETTDPGEKRIINIVEEMAVASGIRVPPVYILEEHSINAFAAGFSPNKAVIAVSRGCLNYLNRDELQGVIAHEFSHIVHGDMALNIKLMGLLHGLLFITIAGRGIFYIFSGTNRRTSGRQGTGNGLALLGLILIVLGSVGVFFGSLIKMAISRQREFLADASAVQYTRNPTGIAGALKKIGGLMYGSRIQNPKAEEASHMFFAEGLGMSFTHLFATHPPLTDRIKQIDPQFNGQYPVIETELDYSESAAPESTAAGFSGPAATTDLKTSPESVVDSIGRIETKHLDYSKDLLTSIPLSFQQHLKSLQGAQETIYALLLDQNSEQHDKQLDILRAKTEAKIATEAEQLFLSMNSLKPELRLPLLEIALPVLENLTVNDYEGFRKTIYELIIADHKINRFEYVLFILVIHSLDAHFGLQKHETKQNIALTNLLQPVSDLLLSLACLGNTDSDRARQAYLAGAEFCGIQDSFRYDFSKDYDFSIEKLDKSLKKISQAQPLIKEKILKAAVACILVDNKITTAEAELIRAISAVLDCPMPPILVDVAAEHRV